MRPGINYQRTNGVQMAAGIALFAMLSLLPLIMLLVSAVSPVVQPIFPGYDMRQGILHFAQITVSPVARLWLAECLAIARSEQCGRRWFHFYCLRVAASNVFSQLDSSFQRIWQEGEANSTSNLRLMVLEQFRRRRNGFLLLLLGLNQFHRHQPYRTLDDRMATCAGRTIFDRADAGDVACGLARRRILLDVALPLAAARANRWRGILVAHWLHRRPTYWCAN